MSSSFLDIVVRLLTRIDRRLIYASVALSLAIPLVAETTLSPAKMSTAAAFFDVVDKRSAEDTRLVLIAMDWGPSTKAENGAQTEVAIEHLMRKRIPFAVISLSPYAGPLLESVPAEVIKRLQSEDSTFRWEYGKDWINLGYQPNGAIFIQNFAKSDNISVTLSTDAKGNPLADQPIMSRVKTLNDIAVFMQFTGLVGTFNMWLQFLQRGGVQPVLLHGCTSITIPEAYIYYVSRQIKGLHEGLAGAAAYEDLLTQRFPDRTVGSALRQNTSLAIAQISILVLVLLGNLGLFLSRFGTPAALNSERTIPTKQHV